MIARRVAYEAGGGKFLVHRRPVQRAAVREAPAYAVIGGLHLFRSSGEELAWTGMKLKEFGLVHLLGAHCTGIETVFRLRQRASLTRKTAVVGAIGSTFSLEGGIDPLALAR